ncbi:cytochrome P450 [Labedaea rhizosphaerae]|uniref:Cytochrome P450 n=1 Tax=Labedaea rhizosphaerae TaxID=598644 RepID=A0A4R6S1C8_LABRH|nr:cytochrome P450 [Labedaea rhizosphaerae]TDP93004.1 cytochrome P450 [Labedaea rhizosphaerae]
MSAPTAASAVAASAAALLRELLSDQGRRDPYPVYARLHELGTVVPLPPDGKHAAIVHGHDAVGRVLRDPGFAVLDGDYLDRTSTRWREHLAVQTMQNSVFHAGGDRLARVRRLFGQVFSASRAATLEPVIERIADRLLDELAAAAEHGAVDVMARFALRLPSDVIGEILGVPEPDRAGFPARVKAFDAILELGQRSFRELRAADTAAAELTAYFAALVAERRVRPADDLVSALAADDRLPEPELLANLIVVFNAGFRTTANLIGNGLHLLLQHPDSLAALRADPALAPSCVEEILRFDPPVHFAVRFAVHDTEVDGVPVPEGRTVLILTAAANRDPARFADPDQFDPTRTDNQHYAFSAGPHYCLGAALGRAVGRIALPRLLTRFPRLALAAEPAARHQFMLRGYDRLDLLCGTAS